MGEGSRTIHSYARKRMEVKEEANCVQMNSYILLLIYCNQRLLMSYNTIIHMRACLHVYSTKINLSVTATMHALVRHDLPREASRRGNYQVVCDHQLEVPQRLHVRVAGGEMVAFGNRVTRKRDWTILSNFSSLSTAASVSVCEESVHII